MFRPVSLFIGLRYTRAKRRNHFISFISLVSMLGIALGVAVLITVLSVMNGFDYQIRHRIFGMARQVTVSSLANTLQNWQSLEKKVANYSGVVAVSPFVGGQGMLNNAGLTQAVYVYGIQPQRESTVSELARKMVSGSLRNLKPSNFGIVLGQQLAQNLGVIVGNKIRLLIPAVAITPVGMIPRFKTFTVVGIFHVGSGFYFDSRLAFINLHDAQVLYQLGDKITGLQLKIKDVLAAPQFSQRLNTHLKNKYFISDWTSQFGALFKAIAMEKTMMFLILLLIIAVAAFNLVSGLVMVVADKRADIAIMRTLGATPRMIMATFMVQGSVVGIVGTLLGLGGGVLLALNATAIVNFIQQLFHVRFLSERIYFINFLPSRIDWSDVWHICIIALVMSLIATLYPAWRAAKTQPAEALRYE